MNERKNIVSNVAAILLLHAKQVEPDCPSVEVEMIMSDIADVINNELGLMWTSEIKVMDGHAAAGCDC